MKKMVLAAVAALFLTSAQAQENRQMNRQHQKIDPTELMVKEYGLDSKQAEELKKLNEKYAELFRHGPHRGGSRGHHPGGARPEGKKHNGTRPDGNGTGDTSTHAPKTDGNTGATAQQPPRKDHGGERAKNMEEHRKQMEAYDQELQGIMTKKQYEKYTKKREEMRKNRQQRFGAPQGEKK